LNNGLDPSSVSLQLPSMLYGVQGKELNLYFDGFVSSWFDLGFYNFDVISNIVGDANLLASRQENYRWTITPGPANVGLSSVAFNAYYGPTLVGCQSATLRIKPLLCAAPVSRKLLTIGDSIIGNNGQPLAELVNLCSQGNITLTTVGTKSNLTATDAQNVVRPVYHEAVPGKSFNYFYTDGASPFVFGGQFDFAQYLNVNGISLSADDWVFIFLGINDMSGPTSDAAMQASIGLMLAQQNAMIANIQAVVPGIRVGLVTTPACAPQDSFGANYGSGLVGWRYKRNRALWLDAMLSSYDKRSDKVFLVPAHVALDTRNNMQVSNTAFNAYNTATFSKQVNAIHPASSGFYQIGASLFPTIRAQEN